MKVRLGAAEAPGEVDSETANRIEDAIDDSFVAAFRLAMFVSAAFALAGALVAALFVGGENSLTNLRNRTAVRTPAGEAGE